MSYCNFNFKFPLIEPPGTLLEGGGRIYFPKVSHRRALLEGSSTRGGGYSRGNTVFMNIIIQGLIVFCIDLLKL